MIASTFVILFLSRDVVGLSWPEAGDLSASGFDFGPESAGHIVQRLGQQSFLSMGGRKLLRHTSGCAQSRDDVFRIGGNPVLVQIHAVDLCLSRQAKGSGGID